MSHRIVSPTSQSSFLNYTKSSLPITSSKLEPSSCLIFNSHLPKLSFFLKPQSDSEGSFKTRPNYKVCAQRLYASTESNFYDLLGIPESVTPREIKQAYKQLVLKYHPDLSPPESIVENTNKFIQVQEAYETLSDPKRRALYDTHLHNEWLDEKGEWRIQWMSQLTELKKRNMNKDLRDDMSWGARMRRQRSKITYDHHDRH